VKNLSIVTTPSICLVPIVFKWDQSDTTSRNIYIGNTGTTTSGAPNVATYTPTNDDFLSRYPTTTNEPVSLNSCLYGTDTSDSWLTYSISLIPFSIIKPVSDILIGTDSTITWQGYAGNYIIHFKNKTTTPTIDITCTDTYATGNSFTWTVPLSDNGILITPGTYQYVVTAIFESRTYTQSIDVNVVEPTTPLIYILNLKDPYLSIDHVDIAWNFLYNAPGYLYQSTTENKYPITSTSASLPYYYTYTDLYELYRYYDCSYLFKITDTTDTVRESTTITIYTSEIIIVLDAVETIGYNSNYNLTWTSSGPTDPKNGAYYGTELIDIYIDDKITTAVNISASIRSYTFNPTALGITASSIDIKLVYDNYHISNTITVLLVENTVTSFTVTGGTYSYDLYLLTITFNVVYNVQDIFTITLFKEVFKEDGTSEYIIDHTIGTSVFDNITTYDWYPYLTFATHGSTIDKDANYKIQIQSGAMITSLTTTSVPFTINPDCLNVTTTGTYTVLSTIDIHWTTRTIPVSSPPANPYSLTGAFNIHLIETDASGNIIVADVSEVWRITPAGAVTKVYTKLLSELGGVCVDAAGNIIVTDKDSHRIMRITPAGAVSAADTASGRSRSITACVLATSGSNVTASVAVSPAGTHSVAGQLKWCTERRPWRASELARAASSSGPSSQRPPRSSRALLDSGIGVAEGAGTGTSACSSSRYAGVAPTRRAGVQVSFRAPEADIESDGTSHGLSA
jgi:hypothetical protein